jgi:hypothetical protein
VSRAAAEVMALMRNSLASYARSLRLVKVGMRRLWRISGKTLRASVVTPVTAGGGHRLRVDHRAPPGPDNEVIPTSSGLIFRKGAGLLPRASVSLNVSPHARNGDSRGLAGEPLMYDEPRTLELPICR